VSLHETTTSELPTSGLSQRILIVDDDPVIRALLREVLVTRGYTVDEMESAADVRRTLTTQQWDLILLDRRLPDCDGLVLLKAIQDASPCPVMILSILGDEHDRVLGLELGAADYLAKPVNLDELCIRVRNTLAYHKPRNSLGVQRTLFGEFSFNSKTRQLTRDEQEWQLTATESRMLECLIGNAGQVFNREQLAYRVFHRKWYPNDRSIDVIIARLRKIIEEDPRKPEWIVTLHGEGYRFRELFGIDNSRTKA
jgi:DNA-binding response OmpR family regulator